MPISRKPPVVEVPVHGKVPIPDNRAVVKAVYAHLPVIQGRPGELIPGFGNIGTGDVVVPRIKLLQGMSPETQPDGGSHPQGKFFQTTAARTIGTDLIVVPLNVRRSVELWDNRESGGGLLARSADGVHWDKPNTKFMIKNRKGQIITADTKGTVQESGLEDFGSSEPGNPRSAPLASTTFRYSFWLEEYSALGVSMLILSRTMTEAAKDLNSRINARVMNQVPFYAQRYNMRVSTRKNAIAQWYVPTFDNAGDIEEPRLLEDLQMRAATLHRANSVTTASDDEALQEDQRTYKGTDRSTNSNY